jgi:hypothetical protein
MSTFPWHIIDSGERFQDLIGCLLLQEVSKDVQIFGKPGRDYSIDASYSGEYAGKNGSWRFQAKHYKNLADLKKELRGSDTKDGKHKDGEVDRILAHLAAAPDDMAYKLWKGVTQYTLMTSLKLLPQERQEIIEILKPLSDIGINVDIWDGEKIEKLCEANPFVMQQQFGDDPPRFLQVAEFRRQQSKGPFGGFFISLPYLGREVLEAQFKTFMEGDQVVFFMHGPGGIGKTRAILELVKHYDVDPKLSVHAIQIEGGQFDQRVPELDETLKHLLVVDDADRCVFLDALLWLVSKHPRLGGRVRLLLASRSALAGTLLSTIGRAVDPRRVTEIALPPIADYSVQLAASLGHNGQVAEVLVQLAEGVPLWIVLASEAVKNGVPYRELTKERVIRTHIERYLAEVAPPEKDLHQRLLDLLATIEPVNIRDGDARKVIAEQLQADPPTVARAMDDVLRSGFAKLRGRFLCIVPDIVADYLLARALVTESGIPTDFQEKLLQGRVPDVRRLVHNLARGEYLTGERLLDGVVAQISTSIDSDDNVQRLSILSNFGVLAEVRPEEFLTTVEHILATPQPDTKHPDAIRSIFGTGVVTHNDVLKEIPRHLPALLRWREYRERALQVLGAIVIAQNFADNAVFNALRLFKATMQLPAEERLDIMWQSLRVLEGWWKDHEELRARLILTGLESLLSFETISMRAYGLEATIATLRLVATPEVKALRAAAIAFLRRLLGHASDIVRTMAASVLAEASRSANSVRSDDKKRSIVTLGGGEDGTEPVVHDLALPEVTDTDYLNEQITLFFSIVEERIGIESSGLVLDELRAVVDWHAKFAPQSLLGKRAQKIEARLLELPAYRLFDIVAGTHGNPLDNTPRDKVVSELIAANRPDAFLADLKGIHRAKGSQAMGRAGSLLTQLGAKHPDYAKQIFDLIKDDNLDQLWFYAANLVVGLRVSGSAPNLLAQIAAKAGLWRRVAAIACSRLRPAWHGGLSLQTADLDVMRELLRDVDPSVCEPVASFLWLIVEDVPDACLDMVEELATRAPDAYAEQIAEVCREAIKLDAKNHSRVRSIIDRLETVANLSGPHVVNVIACLAEFELDWFFNFLERRIQHAETGDPEGLEAVPDGLERELPSRISAEVREVAIGRALEWIRRSDQFAVGLARLIRGLASEVEKQPVAGGNTKPSAGAEEVSRKPLFVAVRSFLSTSPDIVVLERMCKVLRALGDGEMKFLLFGECLLAAKVLPADEQRRLRSALIGAIGGRAMRWRPGEVPPALKQQLALLQTLASFHPDESLVEEFVQEASTSIRRRIQMVRDNDEELLIE